jgi:hypothetical protein
MNQRYIGIITEFNRRSLARVVVSAESGPRILGLGGRLTDVIKKSWQGILQLDVTAAATCVNEVRMEF